MDHKKYCSLDIETSGFDPLKNEILEIGLVFFDIGDDGLTITEEYTKVFKPAGEVSANILGLTGITQKELDGARPFSDYKTEIQEKIRDTIIVGHNVIFDTKFLQSLGIEFSGQVIDTLDMVQFILPTHHSYNLENLMHTFNIDHKDAHRALSDSRATAFMLERLLKIYSGFPKKLKTEVKNILKPYDFVFKPLLLLDLEPITDSQKIKVVAKKAKLKATELAQGAVYNFPVGNDFIPQLANLLGSQKENSLLVLSKQQQVLQLWKQKQAEPLFAPEEQFNEEKFNEFAAKKDLSHDELKFLLKVLVWKYTNWQTKYILDLNLSFFGGQFRSLISGGTWSESLQKGMVCCDQETFLLASRSGLYRKSFVIVVGLSDFEVSVSNTMATKVSWGHILYLLRSVYNPEFGVGSERDKQLVEELLAASDLFFGLVHALLHTATTNFQYCKITPELLESENYKKIISAAEHYQEKLTAAQAQLELTGLRTFIEKLQAFFTEDKNAIKWIELADKRCVLFSSPLDITHLVTAALKPYSKISFVDSLGAPMLLDYFLKRLGLSDWPIKQLDPLSSQPAVQPDLFSSKGPAPIFCHLQSKNINSQELADLVSKDSLPAALLFSTGPQVKQFYEDQYQQLQSRAFLLAQNTTGGGNRMFRNFTIHGNSLLVATDKFILKYLQGANLPVEKLAVKTLIICHLPFEQFNHPYQESLAEQFANAFEEFSLPKAVYNFHCLLDFFNTPMLEAIYIYDAKLTKGYSQAFTDYVQLLPGVKLKV